MKENIKRVLSFLLAVVLLMPLLPQIQLTAEAASNESWLWPVEDCLKITSNFGNRTVNGKKDTHAGIDISSGNKCAGMAVRATKSGTVYKSMNTCGHDDNSATCTCNGRAGNYVVIKHDDGTYSRYLHLKANGVASAGKRVKQGETIGYIGSSGESYGYHLHFDICTDWSNRDATKLNPMPTNSEITVVNASSYSLPSGWPSAKITYIFDPCAHSGYENKDGKLGVCKDCGYVFDWQSTYSPNEAGVYDVTQATTLRTAPYEDAAAGASINKGSKVDVLGSHINAYGSIWYKIKLGNNIYYGYSKRFSNEPVAEITLKASVSGFDPAYGATIAKETYILKGTVKSSNLPLESIEGYLDGTKYTTWNAPNSTTMSVNLQNTSINNKLKFSTLSEGKHTIVLKAYSHSSNTPVEIHSSIFYVEDSTNDGPFKVTCTGFAPTANETVLQATYNVTGTVTSSDAIKSIAGYIDGANYATWTASNSTTKTVNLKDTVINKSLRFSSLAYGKHTIKLVATNTSGETATFLESSFYTCSSKSHTAGETVYENEIDATCTTPGSWDDVVYCSVCGIEMSRETFEYETGHSELSIPGRAPTCTESGWTDGVSCLVCGLAISERVEIPATGHSWNKATCTTPKTCATCGATEGSAAGHTWNGATCTAPETCAVCGATNGTDVKHSWNSEPTVMPATCTTWGFSYYSCLLCGEKKEYTQIAPLGHTEEILPAIPATCTGSGLTEGKKCSVCGETLVAQEVIPAQHTEQILPAVPATCTGNGLTEGKKCSVCGEILAAQEVIPATGHKFASGETACSVCGETREFIVPAISAGDGKITIDNPIDVKIKQVLVFYTGEKVESTIWATRVAAGKKYPEINGTKGYQTYTDMSQLPTLTAEGEYILYIYYYEGTATKNYSIYASVAAAPVEPEEPAELDIGINAAGKVTVSVPSSFGTFTKALVFYVGEGCDSTVWADRVAAGQLYPDVNGTKGYKIYTSEAKLPTLTAEGEYILYLYYTDASGKQKNINKTVTFGAATPEEPDVPTEPTELNIGINASSKVFVEVPSSFGTFTKALVFYVGEGCDSNVWADRVAAGKLYPAVNGTKGYKIYTSEAKLPTLTAEGKYILYLYYTDAGGKQKNINKTVTLGAATPEEPEEPAQLDIGINATGKVTVSVPSAFGTFTKALVFYVGEGCDSTVWADRVAAGKLYPDVNGTKGYKIYTSEEKLPTLTAEGEYILYLYYTDSTGKQKNINKTVTLGAATPEEPAEPGISVNASGKIVIEGVDAENFSKVIVSYAGSDNPGSTWNTMVAAGKKHTDINGKNGYLVYTDPAQLPTLTEEGQYVLMLYYTEDGATKSIRIVVTV